MCWLLEKSQSSQTLMKQTRIKSAKAQWACGASAEMLALTAHVYMAPNQQKTRKTDGKGRGYKKQHIHLRELKNNNMFSSNFISRSQYKTIKILCFNITRYFGEEVGKQSNHLFGLWVSQRGIAGCELLKGPMKSSGEETHLVYFTKTDQVGWVPGRTSTCTA